MNVEYIRLAKGLENQISELIPPDAAKIISRLKKEPTKDFYTSLYKYEDRHFKEFAETHSVAGIRDVKTDRLLWDFDDSVSLETAQKDAKELCARLMESGVEPTKIRAFFSGNKGFHVEVILNEFLSRQEFVNVVFNMAHDLKTFDVRINDEARVIRAPFTINPKSGLYKIPLTIDQLNTYAIEDIKINAADISTAKPYDYFKEANWRIAMPEPITILKTQTFKQVNRLEDKDIKGFNVNDIDFSKCPRWMAKERYALQEGFFYGSESVSVGERNTAFMILAATYRNQGFSEDHAIALLSATAEKQAQRTGEEIVSTERIVKEVIPAVYGTAWKGGIYAKDEPLLYMTRKRFNIEEVEIISDLADIKNVGLEFEDFARHIDQNTVKTGLKRLDESVLITSGMMIALLAAPGAGKTSFANMFVENLSKTGEHTIYFSLDMYKNLLFTRLLQKYSGYPMQKILDMYKAGNPSSELQNAYSQVVANYSNVFFNFRSGPTVEEMEQEIINYKIASGHNPKLMVVDYLEKVKGPFSDATANSGYVASRLSDIAKKHHLVVLLLVQPQKAAGDPSDELTSYRRIKGASVIEQDSRVIMTLSRPGYNPKDMDNDRYASISVVKNNMGNLCQLNYNWDGVSGTLSDMSPEDIKELALLKKRIADEKAKALRGYDI